MIATEDAHAGLRTNILTASLESSNEPGWGYFGIPGSLCIGDNSYAPRLVRKPKDEAAEGEPIRNIQAAPLKRGHGPDVYFNFDVPLCIDDPYQDPSTMMKKGKVQMLDPEAAFKPPGSIKRSTNKLEYEYVPHMDTKKDPLETKEKYPKDYMPPRNILTNPAKKGGGGVYTPGVLFGFDEERKFSAHMPDNYDAPKELRKKEIEEHRAMLQEQPFKCMEYGNKSFFTNEDMFKYDLPSHIPREPVQLDIKTYPHEMPFKPSNPAKKGQVYGCMQAFPEHMPEPSPGGAVRQPPVEGEPPPAFRIGHPGRVCNPTPSVTTMSRNMRAERPASFARPNL